MSQQTDIEHQTPAKETSPSSSHDSAVNASPPKDGASTAARHGFWSKEVAGMRKTYLIAMFRVVILMSVVIWTAMAL